MDASNWDREMAKIDRQLESVSDRELVPRPSAAVTAPQRPARAGRAARFGVFARLALAVTLGVAMLFWPYATRCGAGLFAYLGAVAVVVLAGLWAAYWTWHHRAAASHALALLLVAWGLVLGAVQLLPRVGYARPDVNRPPIWMCE